MGWRLGYARRSEPEGQPGRPAAFRAAAAVAALALVIAWAALASPDDARDAELGFYLRATCEHFDGTEAYHAIGCFNKICATFEKAGLGAFIPCEPILIGPL